MQLVNFRSFYFVFIVLLGVSSCNQNKSEKGGEVSDTTKAKSEYLIPIRVLTDAEYPDDPDYEERSNKYFSVSHPSLALSKNENGTFKFQFLPGNELSDTITFKNININTYLPNTPSWVRNDEYATNIGIVNSEWNRQQIKYLRKDSLFEVSESGYESDSLVRVDIARNCLNSGLWEVSMYSQERGKLRPYYHGYFTFPLDLYKELFDTHTGLSYEKYQTGIEEWLEPESKKMDLSLFRTVESESKVKFENLNNQYYPLTGARVSKRKDIVYPNNISCINDFLTDSTLYSTFSPPGFYTRADPRKTELSRLAVPENVILRKIKNENLGKDSALNEIEIEFWNPSKSTKTRLVIGGVNIGELPILSLEEHNDGFKMPMGISNHPFYEEYSAALKNDVMKNPYYAFLLDKDGNWLDSHKIGIDGPILFRDADNPKMLRLMILSFERHSFVGHFKIDISSI